MEIISQDPQSRSDTIWPFGNEVKNFNTANLFWHTLIDLTERHNVSLLLLCC